MTVAALASRIGGNLAANRKVRASVLQGRVGAAAVVLAQPSSFMNESGGPVAALMSYFGVPAEKLIVVHDELDLPFGQPRVKSGGGDNGHNGLKSIRKSIGTGEYLRIRLGIGRPPGRQDPADFVLRPFSAGERVDLGLLLERGADAAESLIEAGLERTQERFNVGVD